MLKGIIYILINAAAVALLIGNNKAGTKVKVYPGTCPEPEQDPYIITRITSAVDFALSKREAASSFTYGIDVYVYTRTYEQQDEITTAVRTALDKVRGSHGGIDFDEIRYVSFSDGYEDTHHLYSRTINFECVVNED